MWSVFINLIKERVESNWAILCWLGEVTIRETNHTIDDLIVFTCVHVYANLKYEDTFTWSYLFVFVVQEI